MPSPLNYRPHFHRDWISSSTVRRMSFAAEGVYHALLDVQWEDGHIPRDDKDIRAVLMKCSNREWNEFKPHLDSCFPVQTCGTRANVRCSEERANAISRIETNKANAAKGGKAKAKRNPSDAKNSLEPKPSDAKNSLERNASENLPKPKTKTNSNTNVLPPVVPNGDAPPNPAPAKATVDWEARWKEVMDAYPARGGDRRARDARPKYERQAKEVGHNAVLEGVKRYAAYCDAVGFTRTEKVKQMSSFFNQKSWEEEWPLPETPARNGIVKHETPHEQATRLLDHLEGME